MFILLLMCMLICMSPIYACDICGSNTSNTLIDLGGSQPQSYIQYGTFTKAIQFQDPDNDLQKSLMWGQLLTGAYTPHEKVELKAVLPILHLSNTMRTGKGDRYWGLGDMLLQAQVQIWNRKPFERREWAQTLTLMGGVELPTGSYAVSEDPLLSNISFGSKSFDFVLGGNYRINKFKGALTSGTIVKLNTANKEKMYYGNSYGFYQQGSYEVYSGKHKIILLGGWRYDMIERNILRNIYQPKSGGHLVQSILGIQGKQNQWTWNLNYLQPLWQKNGKDAFVHKQTLLASFQYQFKSK